jgi:hypothetical protein
MLMFIPFISLVMAPGAVKAPASWFSNLPKKESVLMHKAIVERHAALTIIEYSEVYNKYHETISASLKNQTKALGFDKPKIKAKP